MGTFKRFEFENEDYLDVILLTDVEDLYFTQEDIYETLSPKKGESFSILIDMFLRNGYSFNRYTLLEYNGPRKIKSYLVNSRDVSENIKKCVKSYLIENTDLLYDSSLTENAINYVLGIS